MATRNRKVVSWIVGAVVVVLLVVVGGPFVYFHFIQGDPPPKLSLDTAPTPTTAPGTTAAPLAGTWKISGDSVVRYRIKETVFGQSGTAVGRDERRHRIDDDRGDEGDRRDLHRRHDDVPSDSNQRDGQFQRRIMDTAELPDRDVHAHEPDRAQPGTG